MNPQDNQVLGQLMNQMMGIKQKPMPRPQSPPMNMQNMMAGMVKMPMQQRPMQPQGLQQLQPQMSLQQRIAQMLMGGR